MNESSTVCGAESLGADAPRCPICKNPGKKVKPETVSSIVKEDRVPTILAGYTLCLTKDCDVVYFGLQIFDKKDVKIKVWFKETGSSRPICYCANVTESDITDHILRGCCKDLKDIQQHTGANTGKECLTKNPAGT